MTDRDTDNHSNAPESNEDEEPSRAAPGDDLKEGLNLLWKAAVGAADEIRKEVDRGGVRETLRDAGRDLEAAASRAASTIETLLDRVSPPAADYQKSESAEAQDADPAGRDDDGEASSGATNGDARSHEPRDMRIQLEDES